MTSFQEYRKDRREILYHPVKVTDEGIRLMVKVIDEMEVSMRRFINYELPDCMSREEMKTLLDGERIPKAVEWCKKCGHKSTYHISGGCEGIDSCNQVCGCASMVIK